MYVDQMHMCSCRGVSMAAIKVFKGHLGTAASKPPKTLKSRSRGKYDSERGHKDTCPVRGNE